ncbi:MAG: Holliday junction resolvase RuvX [Clostridia bacterium]|nr:Holliday junction resolvase RuvX [Clostridia bacterium]
MNGEKQGRILGVDYGDVRTGLAVSDLLGFMASGIGTIKPGGMRNTAEAVAKEAEAQGAVLIVIGLPKNMDGSEGFRAEAVRAFAALLAEYTAIPYTFADERLSTAEAHKILNITNTGGKKRKGVIDTLSAQIILQSYLDAHR